MQSTLDVDGNTNVDPKNEEEDLLVVDTDTICHHHVVPLRQPTPYTELATLDHESKQQLQINKDIDATDAITQDYDHQEQQNLNEEKK